MARGLLSTPYWAKIMSIISKAITKMGFRLEIRTNISKLGIAGQKFAFRAKLS